MSNLTQKKYCSEFIQSSLFGFLKKKLIENYDGKNPKIIGGINQDNWRGRRGFIFDECNKQQQLVNLQTKGKGKFGKKINSIRYVSTLKEIRILRFLRHLFLKFTSDLDQFNLVLWFGSRLKPYFDDDRATP